ncbi:MAG: short-chain dehydrogenase/reductase SDR [Rhodobacteraceae bacterium]|uniref:SDR family NAD(P)-dependent oxidoreductase n=1 Tax=Cypionkella sp. TaxID=2811411 RepID=UPI0013250DFA|nr:SDR family oxidoreductase [Cypionkella sp.]KAF0173298.1 MAG: short-chain dehydrogenase/reductase SDR [Paracoccaceae bacterium]MDO8327681.1 SDR family oxidoreductase [Cypionkella sp.]
MTQRIALITGASRGLGAALAEQLCARGWHVVAVARTVGGLEELDDRVKTLGLPGAGELTLAPMDVTNDDAMRHLCLSIHQRWGKLNLWVHPAVHVAPLAPAGSMDIKDWDKSIATNTRATGSLIPMIEPLLRAGDGTALFLDDPRGGQKFFGAYGATKAAQIALARSWAAENANIGPRVLIETPAPMPTATRARFFPGEDRTPLTHPRDEANRLINLL